MTIWMAGAGIRWAGDRRQRRLQPQGGATAISYHDLHATMLQLQGSITEADLPIR
jgi:hypothetical protein